MRLLICAGGTGGGVYPALAVLQALSPENSADAPAQPVDVLWVGGVGGLEADLVKRAGVAFSAIPAAGVHGVGLRALPGNVARLVRGFYASRRLLANFRPEVLFFTGGYIAVPMALAAYFPIRGFPRPRSLVFVPDIEPSMAIQALLRIVDHVAVVTEDSRAHLVSRAECTVTGYPVRKSMLRTNKAEARRSLGLADNLPTLGVFGGSKGSRSINRAVIGALPELLPEMQIVHVSGNLDWPEVESAGASLSVDLRSRYRTFPYLHDDDMGAALCAADLALSRAGASCLGEFPAFGLPAILAPYPYAWRYQKTNAEYLAQRGAAVIVPDAELPMQVAPWVLGLMRNAQRCEQMSQAMASLACPRAAETIAVLLTRLAADRNN